MAFPAPVTLHRTLLAVQIVRELPSGSADRHRPPSPLSRRYLASQLARADGESVDGKRCDRQYRCAINSCREIPLSPANAPSVLCWEAYSNCYRKRAVASGVPPSDRHGQTGTPIFQSPYPIAWRKHSHHSRAGGVPTSSLGEPYAVSPSRARIRFTRNI